MEEFPFIYNRKNKERINKKSGKTREYSTKTYTFKKLVHSNSDSDFIRKTEKERRKIIRQYLNKKTKITDKLDSQYSKIKTPLYKRGVKIKKIIKKDKDELSSYIQNNTQEVELFGNPRYNRSSPYLFVEDVKNQLSEKKMGLVPLPSKKKDERRILKEPQNLYDMQRNITMARRFQYVQNNEKKLKTQRNNKYNTSKDNGYFNMIQSWWKKIPKIIDIQRIYRGYLVRRQATLIIKLYRFMKEFENFLNGLQLRVCFKKIKEYSALRRKTIINGHYISKECCYVSNNIFNNILTIEKGFRCFKARKKRRYLERAKLSKIINDRSFMTKQIYFDNNQNNNNIIMIQNNVRQYLKNKNYIDKHLIHKNNGIHYYEKVYLNKENHKIINFMKIMIHILRLLGLKKKIFYKYPNDYNNDDINKIKYIQKKYLNHYYNKIKKISLYNIKQKFCFMDILRKKEIINDITIIQKAIKNHLDDKKTLDKNIIRKKPILGGTIYNNNNNNNDINKKYKSGGNKNTSYNYNNNNISYISKDNIKNVNDLIIPVQKRIHKIFEKIVEQRSGRKNKIIKTNFKKNYFFTKEYSDQEKCLKRLTQLQNLYKKQYKYNKDNTIKNDIETTDEYNSLEDCSKPKYTPLRKRKYKNKIPKKIEFGLYISKQKYINHISKYTVNYNMNDDHLKFRQEGLYITKVRHINNDKKIKKIQNMFKNYKKKYEIMNEIQKPLTDNKFFFTFSSDSYDDIK